MPNSIRALIAEDSVDDAELLLLELARGGFAVRSLRVDTAEEMRAALVDGAWDIVISDYSMPRFSAAAALRLTREFDPDLPFVVISGTIGEEQAVEMMRAGASDYLLKGKLARLAPVVERELREAAKDRAHRTVEQLAAQLAAIVESSDEAILSETLDGQITSWNPGAERLFGWKRSEAIGRHSSFIVPEDKASEFAEVMSRLQRGERLNQFETVRLHRNGGRRDVSVTASPIHDRSGQFIGVAKITRDITLQKMSQVSLLKSEERYRTLVSATSSIVWSSPASGEFDSDQPGWTAFTGQTVEQHQGWGWLNALHPEDREKCAQAWAIAIRQRTPYQVEHRIRRTDGVYRMMSVRAVPIFESTGEIREWVGVHTDVTDQKISEQAVHDAQQRLEQVLASSPAILYTLFLKEHGILACDWVSDNIRELFGYSSQEALAPDWWSNNVHPDDLEEVASRTVSELFAAGATASDYRFRHQNGEYRWVRSDVRLIRTPKGEPLVAVGSWTDITGIKLLEEQFRHSQKLEAFGQLAAGVAHDFNNLLTIINGYSDLLLDCMAPGDPMREMVGEIHKAGDRSAGLTRQLLAFSRKQVLAPRILDLNEVVSATEKMLRRLIGEDVRLITSRAPSLWQVKADPGQVEQVLMNLAVNARDAMPQGGRLTIETHNVELDDVYARTHPDASAGSYVLLSITDTGGGMPAEVRSRIFEPFFTTKEAGKGTGLGLATVYGIVRQSGGHVDVASEVGVGTTFKVYLPRTEAGPKETVDRAKYLAPPHGPETILLVEDEDGVRDLARIYLVRCGYTVLEAANGAEATRIVAEYDGPIHLLVTDVVMPGAGGRMVSEVVIKRHPKVRVLFISGYTDDAVIRHGVLREETNFLQKPFTPLKLATTVREVLDAPARALWASGA